MIAIRMQNRFNFNQIIKNLVAFQWWPLVILLCAVWLFRTENGLSVTGWIIVSAVAIFSGLGYWDAHRQRQHEIVMRHDRELLRLKLKELDPYLPNMDRLEAKSHPVIDSLNDNDSLSPHQPM